VDDDDGVRWGGVFSSPRVLSGVTTLGGDDAASSDARGDGDGARARGAGGDGDDARVVERARVDEWTRACAVDGDDVERTRAGAGVGVGDAEAGVEFAARVVGAGLRLDEGDGDERIDWGREHGTQPGGAEIVRTGVERAENGGEMVRGERSHGEGGADAVDDAGDVELVVRVVDGGMAAEHRGFGRHRGTELEHEGETDHLWHRVVEEDDVPV
jgi:hypothetical protein